MSISVQSSSVWVSGLRSIPPEIARLSTLTMLDLARNFLKVWGVLFSI